MKKLIQLTVFMFLLFSLNSFSQTKWANWAPLDNNNGIKLEYRFGYYKSYNGQQNTELQIKAYNTRNKKVMVNFKSLLFSTGVKDYGGHLFYANEDSYTFTFRSKGVTDRFEYNWSVEYYSE